MIPKPKVAAMFSLFQNPGTPRQPRYEIPELNNGFLALKNNVQKLKHYCRTNHSKVQGSNVLIRLLHSLPIALYDDVQFYYDSIYDIRNDLASALRIANVANKGRAHREVLFANSLELPIALSDGRYQADYTKLVLERGWCDLAPIRFIRHSCSDVRMERFNGVTTQAGLSVYLVDIPLLALQYHCWSLEERQKPEGERYSLQHFLAMYPLPNAVESWVDIAWLNRCIAKAEYESYSEKPPVSGLPIHFALNHRYMENGCDEIAYRMRMGGKSYADLLRLCRVPFAGTTEELLRLPDVYLTEQIRWALGAGQIGWVWWLRRNDNGNNGVQNNRLVREIRMGYSGSALVRLLDAETRYSVEAEFLQVLAY